jgi:hypothetical protein
MPHPPEIRPRRGKVAGKPAGTLYQNRHCGMVTPDGFFPA